MKNLNDFIVNDDKLGCIIKYPYHCLPHNLNPGRLRYYSIDETTAETMRNNTQWAKSGIGSPRFQFVYLFLPTPCNQRCKGCFMGQDKNRHPTSLKGKYFSQREIDQITEFSKQHGARAIVYGGGGELFLWQGAFDFIESITSSGMGMVIFTNGTCLKDEDVARLNSLGVVIIISLRDTVESYHNAIVGVSGFRKSIRIINIAIGLGMHKEGRLAVEMPATMQNEGRVICDLLPVLRTLGIAPWIEEYIQISTSEEEKVLGHSFEQARKFFKKLAEKDLELGIRWRPEFGQRMLDHPRCQRALYSFAIFPNRDVINCPSGGIVYGNIFKDSLENILRSEIFRRTLLKHDICPCSVFYTADDQQIPRVLPAYLEELR